MSAEEDLDALEMQIAHANFEVRRMIEQLFCALIERDEALRGRENDVAELSQLLSDLGGEFATSKFEFRKLGKALKSMDDITKAAAAAKEESKKLEQQPPSDPHIIS